MSTLKEYYQQRKEKDAKFFFGDDVKIMGDTYAWNHVKNDDEIVIVTNNIQYWLSKEVYVLVVDNNKVVYLKDWQVKSIKNWDLGVNSYAVKLNRKFFKVYTLSFNLDKFSFNQEDTFDSLLNLAKEQNSKNISWKLGHYNF